MNSNKTDLGLALLRISFSALMLTHGFGKLQMLLNGDEFASVLGMGSKLSLILAVIGEFIAPILIIIGFKTRIAAIFPMITMLVAALVIHAEDPFGKKEFPLLYFFGFLAVFLLGAGKYSIDNMKK